MGYDKDESDGEMTVNTDKGVTDEGKKTMSAEKKVINVDEQGSESPPLVKTFGAGVAKRLRSCSGKAIPSVPKSPVVESVKKSVKKQMYGPPRPRSKYETPVVQK